MTWDAQNRMVTCTLNGATSTFTYGADGLRGSSTVGGVTTNYALDGQNVVPELRGGTATATYLTGPTGPMYRRDDVTGQVRWYVYDGLGSVVGEVDPNGNMTATRQHDVYGLVRQSTGTRTSAHGFCGSLGHVSEENTGLIYMRARYMDPVSGRFVSEDPGRQGGNLFAYCGGNPVNLVDADGREAVAALIGLVVGALLGGISAYYAGQNVMAGVLCGAAAGGIGGLFGNPALAGFVGSALGSIFSDISQGRQINLARAIIVGLAGGAVGGAIGGILNLDKAISSMGVHFAGIEVALGDEAGEASVGALVGGTCDSVTGFAFE